MGVPVVLPVFSDHAFDVMLAIFFCKFRSVCKCAVDFSLVKFGGGTLVFERHCGLAHAKGEIWVIVNVTNDEFKT